jgi:hypothetical protein
MAVTIAGVPGSRPRSWLVAGSPPPSVTRVGRSHTRVVALAQRRRDKGRGPRAEREGACGVPQCPRGSLSPNAEPDGIPSFRSSAPASVVPLRRLQTCAMRAAARKRYLVGCESPVSGFGPYLQHLATIQVIPLYICIYIFVLSSKSWVFHGIHRNTPVHVPRNHIRTPVGS